MSLYGPSDNFRGTPADRDDFSQSSVPERSLAAMVMPGWVRPGPPRTKPHPFTDVLDDGRFASHGMVVELLKLVRWLAAKYPPRPRPRFDESSLGQAADRDRDGGSVRPDDGSKQPVGQREIDLNPVRGHLAPSVGEVPEDEEDSVVEPAEMTHGQVEGQPVNPQHESPGDCR